MSRQGEGSDLRSRAVAYGVMLYAGLYGMHQCMP